MDGLALLCNLHAEGPLTLRRLRAAGVHDLRELTALAEADLVACLGFSPGRARRFLEEGSQLALRLAEGALGPEVPDPTGEEAPAHRPAAPVASPRERSPERAREDRAPMPQAASLHGPSAALRAWSLPPPASLAAEPGLRAGELEGLDARVCERLAAQGVRTLSALVERASLELSRAAGVPYPRLLDLACQARLRLSGAPEVRAVEVVPEPPRRAAALAGLSVAPAPIWAAEALAPSRMVREPVPASPRTPPALEPGDPGPSGPFG